MGIPDSLRERLGHFRSVTVLTGAGISAESGVPTFRDAQTGLWAKYDPMTLATPEAWREDAPLVWAWYQKRRAMMRAVEPNAGHLALAELARYVDVRIVTQNVDDLHERAGSAVLAHLHGSLFATKCDTCAQAPEHHYGEVFEPNVERLDPPGCDCGGSIRPAVVWFGEMLPTDAFTAAVNAARNCDLLLSIGTSGTVYPAAELPYFARARGATIVEINPQETEQSWIADYAWRESAAVALPELVAAFAAASQPEQAAAV